MTSSTIHTPSPVPVRHDALPPQKLTDNEQAEYDQVFAHFDTPEYVLPDADTEKSALMEEERMWLSYECILRYLRATRHDPLECIKRLEATLKWRRDFGLYSLITPEHVEPEAVTGKIFTYGYDTHGRPIIYCCMNKQNTKETPRHLHITFWIIERAIELMGPGVESIGLMVDYANKGENASFSLSRQLLHFFQNHYPERLGVAIIGHPPWLFQAFWRLITPFMDRVTYSKFVLGPVSDNAGLWRSAAARDWNDMDAMLFTADQLLSEGWSGSVPFEYVHEIYWPALLAMCQNRRKELTRVWRQLGGVVGIKEWDVKVGVQDGLTVPATVSEDTPAESSDNVE